MVNGLAQATNAEIDFPAFLKTYRSLLQQKSRSPSAAAHHTQLKDNGSNQRHAPAVARIRAAMKQANDAGESVTGLPFRPLAVREWGGVMSQNTDYRPSELTSLSRQFEEAALRDHSKWDRIVTIAAAAKKQPLWRFRRGSRGPTIQFIGLQFWLGSIFLHTPWPGGSRRR